MLSRTFKIQHFRVVWDDLTFQCHQKTIFTLTRSNGGHSDLHYFLPRWPPVWCSLFFNPDLSSAPSKTPKMTPHLPSLFNVQGNGVWPPFDLHLYRKWPQFDLVWVKMVIWWHWNVKSSQSTLECWILKVVESIYDFGGHGGQMEVKTRSDRYGDGIFGKYGQK